MVMDTNIPKGVTKDENRAALYCFMFRMQKLFDKVKGRGCSDGNNQR